MGGVLSRGTAAADVYSKTSVRAERHDDAASIVSDEQQLPPLLVLKESGTQTTLSYQSDRGDRPLLINRVALWILFFGLLPYFVLVLAVAHTEFLQSLLTYAHFPTFITDPAGLQDLPKHGFIAARNIHLIRSDGVLLRGWHVAPMVGTDAHLSKLADLSASQNTTEIDKYYDADLAKGTRPLVIYFHGNTHDRTLWYRKGLVKTLTDTLGAHVITFDYAGFGDSEGWPSEASTYQDAEAIYKWVQDAIARGSALLSNKASCKAPPISECVAEFNQPKIVLWGHSLGSGIVAQLAQDLDSTNIHSPSSLAAVVLEAPFTSFSDAVRSHPNGRMLRLFSGVQEYVVSRLRNRYDTVSKIGNIRSRLLIIHSKQDKKIPIAQARQLYDTAISLHAARAAAETDPPGSSSAPPPAELLELEQSTHNNNFQQPQFISRVLRLFGSL